MANPGGRCARSCSPRLLHVCVLVELSRQRRLCSDVEMSIAMRGIRYLALIAVLVLASSCLYFLKTPTLPSVGTGYLSPSTVLPNYVSSNGIPACSDTDELDHAARLAGTPESGEEDRIGVTRILEYMERHLHAKQRHFDSRADKEWLGINIGRSWDLASYRQELMDTYTTYLAPQGEPMPEYMHLVQSRLSLRSPEMVHPLRPRQILTTTKERPLPWSFSRWRSLHRGWKIRVFEDERLRLWVEDAFRGTRAETVWAGLPRAVLKTDVFRWVLRSWFVCWVDVPWNRYMAMLLEGGVYADSDTAPVIPVDQWGTPYENATDPLLAHLSRAVSPLRDQAEPDVPSLVLSVESDAIEFGWDNWRDVGLVRAVQIVQWTMAVSLLHLVSVHMLSDGGRHDRVIQCFLMLSGGHCARRKRSQRWKSKRRQRGNHSAREHSVC